jgi:hypothetical protein
MILTKAVLVLAIIACFAYMFLGLAASQHQDNDSSADKSWVISPLWALFPAAYDEVGKSLCAKGRPVFWAATGLTLMWILLDNFAVG